MGLFRCLMIGAFILVVPLALITTNIRIAISQQRVYDYSVRNYHAASTSGLPESELLRANGEIKRYLTADDPGPLAISVTDRTGHESSLFNARETAHMADVRNLARMLFTLHRVILAVLLTLAIAILVLWPPRALIAAACCGGILTTGIVAAAGIIALTGFNAAWSQLHVLAFSNDLWQLDPNSDHLIQMFPEAFWQRISMLLGLVTLAEAVIVSGAAALYLVLTRPIAEPSPELPAPSVVGAAGHARPRLAPPSPRHYSR